MPANSAPIGDDRDTRVKLATDSWLSIRERGKPTMTCDNGPGVKRTPRRHATALALLGAMFIALAMVCGASLSAGGSSVLHEVMNALSFGRMSTIESEQ